MHHILLLCLLLESHCLSFSAISCWQYSNTFLSAFLTDYQLLDTANLDCCKSLLKHHLVAHFCCCCCCQTTVNCIATITELQYLWEAFHVTLDHFRVRTFEFLDDIKTLVELGKHISDWTREQSVLRRFLELHAIKHTNTSQFHVCQLVCRSSLCLVMDCGFKWTNWWPASC